MAKLEATWPRGLKLAYAAIWAIGALCVLALLGGLLSIYVNRYDGFNLEWLLLGAHTGLLFLLVAAAAGMSARKRWGLWAGLAAFAELAALGALVGVCVLSPRPLLGGLADPDWWPLPAMYLACGAPGALLLRERRAYLDAARP